MPTNLCTSLSVTRFNKALDFDMPDKIPVIYHPSPAGLATYGRELLELFNAYPPDNAVMFDHIPQPDPQDIGADGKYRQVTTDVWGTTWENLHFGLTGQVLEYPIRSWHEAVADYSFPQTTVPDESCKCKRSCRYVIGGWISLFEKMHALYPMDDLLIDLVTEELDCLAFLDRLMLHWQQEIDRLIQAGVDAVMFGDDWGTQHGPIVSPDLFAKHFLPRYKVLMEPIRQAGVRIFFHSCGKLDAILDDILALDVNAIWPQLPVYDEQTLAQKCRDTGTALYLHPDRQRLIPLGTPDEIDRTIARYAQRYHDWNGGGFFYVEIEGDAPFENVKTLIEAIDRWR